MTRKILCLLLVGGLLALAAAGCSSRGDEEASTTEGVETTAPAEEDVGGEPSPEDAAPATTPEDEGGPSPEAAAPAGTPEDEGGPSAEAAAGPAASDEGGPPPEGAFSQATEALAGLESYRYATRFAFTEEDGDELEAGSIELLGTVAAPDEKHLVWMDLGEGDRFEVIQIGDRAWIRENEEPWQETPLLVAEAMSQAVLVYAPSIAWQGVFGELEPDATYLGRESIYGVRTHHYSSTYSQWGSYWPGELLDAAGEVWIAEEGYPVRYSFTATGIDEDGERGSISWTMELVDVNTEITVEPPVTE